MPSYRELADAEERRVREILDRDRRDAQRERDREDAHKQVASGNFGRFEDTVMEPTPEWLAKAETRSFTPKQPDGTVKVIRTVRRVSTPIVEKMALAGKLSDDQRDACLWYRGRHDLAGMDGHASASQWNPTSTIRRGAVDAGYGYLPTSEMVAEARDEFRAARQAMTAFYLRFFDAVVLHDVPVRRAERFARCRNGKGPVRFRACCNELIVFMQKNKIVVRPAFEEVE